MFSFLCLLYLSLISVFVALITYIIFFRKGSIHDKTSAQEKIKFIKKHVPPKASKGWQLKSVDSGLRIWQKDLGGSTPPWMSRIIYACSGIIPASKQEVMKVLKQPFLLLEWDPSVKTVSQVTTGNNQDVVSVSFNCSSFLARAVLQLREIFGGETKAVYSRHWDTDLKTKSEAWFVSSFVEQVIPAEGSLLSCFLVSSMDNGDDEPSESLVSLIVAPVSERFASIPQLTVSRVAGLQDFFTHYKPDQSHANSVGSEPSNISLSGSDNHVTHLESINQTGVGDLLGGAVDLTDDNKMIKRGKESVGSDSHLPEFLRSESLEGMLQKVMDIYQATEGTDNWISQGNTKGLDILKRPPMAGERPWDCYRATSVINVPLDYILAYIYELDFRGEWDDMFLKGETVEEIDPITKVNRLEYKPQWPASGRDFCVIAILREIDEGVIALASEAVEHERCPEKKGIVRAEIITGGFVVKELSSDPPSYVVTYMTRVDLKGNLPARLVNRVLSSQPQALAVLRDKLEACYQAEVEVDGLDTSQLRREGTELCTALMKAKSSQQPQPDVEREEKVSLQGWSLLETQDTDSVHSSEMTDRFDPNNISQDSGEMFPITDEQMKFSHVDRHQLDYRTLSNQAAANLLGEVQLASQVEISVSEEMGGQASQGREGEWSYRSIEKDVVILQKTGDKIHSFLGKGMIKAKPPTVYEAVRNHMTRHVYDRMLKKTKLVRQIDDQTKIIYCHHETTQCFVKQSRDSVALIGERVEPERYLIAGTSVDIPELPQKKDIIRMKVHVAGWVIEPMLQNGQLYSMVSYLTQLDFGGPFPATILNRVGRRQPLCIAYLRDHLEKKERKASTV